MKTSPSILSQYVYIMDNDTTVAISSLLIGFYANEMHGHKKGKKRKVWVKPWIKAREVKGAYNALVSELSLTDREDYRRFMRMNPETFHELLGKVRPFIEKKTTNMRKPISAEEKLAVTLRYLATGENFKSLSFLFRIHDTTISNFVPVAVVVVLYRKDEGSMQISQNSKYTMCYISANQRRVF